MPKKIEANLSSLVDLKAELFRKQEVHRKQSQSTSSSLPVFVAGEKLVDKEKIARKEAKEARRRAGERETERSEAEKAEEDRKLRESRRVLEEKAKIYERLKKSGTHDSSGTEEDRRYLVDFDQKLREEEAGSESEPDEKNPAAEDERWVEFTDTFGRTRKCMIKDLAAYIRADKDASTSKSGTDTRESEETADIPSADGPVHYQHVLRDEAWEHGVAYFKFAKDEDSRAQQLEELNKMRQQTMESRVKSNRLRQKRKEMLEARLKKVKERKKLRVEGEEEADLSASSDEKEEEPVDLAEIPLPEESKAPPVKVHPVRPWDKGKAPPPGELWIRNRREERASEFAPPSSY